MDCLVDAPEEAFNLAERLGVAADLDARARRAVLAAVAAHPWSGLLFINIHPDALTGLDVDELVTDLAAVGLEPADVVLEVTEQAGTSMTVELGTSRSVSSTATLASARRAAGD